MVPARCPALFWFLSTRRAVWRALKPSHRSSPRFGLWPGPAARRGPSARRAPRSRRSRPSRRRRGAGGTAPEWTGVGRPIPLSCLPPRSCQNHHRHRDPPPSRPRAIGSHNPPRPARIRNRHGNRYPRPMPLPPPLSRIRHRVPCQLPVIRPTRLMSRRLAHAWNHQALTWAPCRPSTVRSILPSRPT
jgi:hypothetical protein